MPFLLPSPHVVQYNFSQIVPFGASRPSPLKPSQQPTRKNYRAREDLYTAWSTTDDIKKKAEVVGDKAVEKFEKASSAAQAKAGKIELYSMKYYAACTFGGLLACVCRIPRAIRTHSVQEIWELLLKPRTI